MKLSRFSFGVFILLIVHLAFPVTVMAGLGLAKATIRVVGEDGSLISNANVNVGFESYSSDGRAEKIVSGYTDDNGSFTVTNRCSGHLGIKVIKDGYYDSFNIYDFTSSNIFGWSPWNPKIDVLLRKIVQPIPMFARKTEGLNIEIPVLNEDVGFDLILFDWVSPYGKGINSDFIFNLKKDYSTWDNQDCILQVTFSNKYDGIIKIKENLRYGSEFKLSRYAPNDGYVNKLNIFIKAVDGSYKTNISELDNYYFRIRSIEEDGKLLKSMYGKIIGALEFSPVESNTAYISFKYYLNPDYTRNLEYDVNKNLFGRLPRLERVGIR